jgi:hypothetical protein
LLLIASVGSARAGDTPRASKEDLAIAAVMAHSPAGDDVTIGSLIALWNMAGGLLGNPYKSIGWAAQPESDGWLVTFVYIGGMGLERHALWRVTLEPKRTVTAVNEFAKDAEEKLLGLSRERAKDKNQDVKP